VLSVAVLDVLLAQLEGGLAELAADLLRQACLLEVAVVVGREVELGVDFIKPFWPKFFKFIDIIFYCVLVPLKLRIVSTAVK
jgi:hypothetical protein